MKVPAPRDIEISAQRHHNYSLVSAAKGRMRGGESVLALYIIGGILLLIFLLLLIPVGGEAVYDEDGFHLWLRAGPLRLLLLPREPKPGDEEKKAKKAAQKAEKKKAKAVEKKKQKEKPKEKKGGGIKEILELIPVGTQALGGLLNKLIFKRIELHFCFASPEDPAKAAMSFGGAWAGAGVLVPLLKEKLKVKHVDVTSDVDFTASETLVWAHGDLRIRPLWVVAIALRAGGRFIKIHRKYAPPHERKAKTPPEEEPKNEKLTRREIAERKKNYGKASDR